MEAFVAAADAGSYAAAAERLDMSAQMVAKHITTLETRLGVRLLNRTTRRQSLTEFGEQYLERCRLIVAEAEAADAMASEVVTQPRGRIRISAPLNYGAANFMAFVQRYLDTHPLTEIELVLSDTYVDVTEDGFEAVFRAGDVVSEIGSLVSRVLRPYRLIPCASPGYLAAHGEPLTPEDLIHHNCISYLFLDRRHETEWVFAHNGKTLRAPIAGKLRVNDMRASIAAALGGFGIVMGAEETLREFLETGELIHILKDYEGPSRPLNLVYRADRQRTAKLRSFIDAAVEWFAT